MHSAAAAFAWSFRQRHRWGLAVIVAYFVALAILKWTLHGAPVVFRDEESFAFAVITPLAATFIYFLAVFTYGLDGDIAAPQSMYPPRMYTLPLSAAGLAGWPMLFGGAAMAALWLATRALAVWPAGERIPVMWPALLGASLMAWTQALTWTSYPMRGLRVVVTVLWLSTIDAIVMVALHYRAGEAVMLAILAPHVPLAFFVARRAVGRARCNDVWLLRRHATRRADEASAPPCPTRSRNDLPSPSHPPPCTGTQSRIAACSRGGRSRGTCSRDAGRC